MLVKHLDHVNLTVASFEESAAWYRRVFGFEVVERGSDSERNPWGVLRSGDALLCIYERPGFRFEKYQAHVPRRVHAIARFGLRITDRGKWEETLEREKVECIYSDWHYPHSRSWYVVDPTGWEIEVALWDGDTVSFSQQDSR